MFLFSRRDRINSQRRSRIFKGQAHYLSDGSSRGTGLRRVTRMLPKLALVAGVVMAATQGWNWYSQESQSDANAVSLSTASGRVAVALPGQPTTTQAEQLRTRLPASKPVVNSQSPQRNVEMDAKDEVNLSPSEPKPAIEIVADTSANDEFADAAQNEEAEVETAVSEQAADADVQPDPVTLMAIATLDDPILLPSSGMMEAPKVSDYVVTKGDTLSGLFDKFGIAHNQVYQVMEADYSVLALDTLMPGNHIRLTQTDTDLMQLELIFDAAHQVVYRRNGDGFEVTEVIIDGDWKASATELAINGSFSLSAQKAGLGQNEIMRIANLFDDKLDFNRTLRAGDKVQILRESQYIEGESTGRQRLLAISFAGRNWEQSAYLHEDGNFYDDEGESLARAFMRVPLEPRTRITSSYNPRRKHPVTRRISPHNGTDFAGRTGTPVLASGDGRVSRAVNHPIAGKYVVIDHGGKFRSRYLHLSRINVRKGQQVTRGQRIGAVGATGRVTGPHLHYELHINGRPVNPMTAKIPMATAVKKGERAAFDTLVAGYRNRMTELTQVAKVAKPEVESESAPVSAE